MEKVVYARRGDVLKVECLEDGVTGQGYFLVRDSAGRTAQAGEIKVGNTLFTMDESKRTFSRGGLEYDLFLHIRSMAKSGEKEGILTKNIALSFNEKNDLGFLGITARTVGKLCRSMGLRLERIGEGYVVAVGPQDLAAASKRFTLQAE